MKDSGPARRARLLAQYEAGETQSQLAAREGVSAPRINQLLQRARHERAVAGGMTSTRALANVMCLSGACMGWPEADRESQVHMDLHMNDAERIEHLLSRSGYEVTKK